MGVQVSNVSGIVAEKNCILLCIMGNLCQTFLSLLLQSFTPFFFNPSMLFIMFIFIDGKQTQLWPA